MDFCEKLKTKKEQKETAAAALDKNRQDWHLAVQKLYGQIEEWFKECTEKDVMSIKQQDTIKYDPPEGAGEPELDIIMDDKTIIFEPIGRNKIDFYTKDKNKVKYHLLRNQESENIWLWHIAYTSQDRKIATKQLTKVTKDVLLEAFDQLIFPKRKIKYQSPN